MSQESTTDIISGSLITLEMESQVKHSLLLCIVLYALGKIKNILVICFVHI